MTLRIVLTVAEIGLLVAVLAFFVRRLTMILAHIGNTLEKISDGVKAIDGHCSILGPGADEINRRLTDAAGGLEHAAMAAERLSR